MTTDTAPDGGKMRLFYYRASSASMRVTLYLRCRGTPATSICKRTPMVTGPSTRAGEPGASQNAIRSTPSTTSKYASLLSTGRSCWRASAAIQTSLGGMGLPACFSSRRMLA